MNEVEQPAVQYCSMHSSLAHESLIASASRTDYWILLEYPEPVTAKALEESQLPTEVKQYLAVLQSNLPYSRILLIRQKRRSDAAHPLLYVADGRDRHAFLYKYSLDSYSDILRLDIPGILTGEEALKGSLCSDRLLLVCTNGRRDACCSKWGLPVYITLEKQFGEQVWESSHVGGHRFAPNLVCLPHGIFFGRMPLEGAGVIAERYLSGHLSLDYYRGRASYPAPVQAAEYFLRREIQDDRIECYPLVKFVATSENQWTITFMHPQSNATYTLEIEARLTGEEIFESCNSPHERKAVKEYCLIQPPQVS
jgi:hypothetical protein